MTDTNTKDKRSMKCLFLLSEKGKWGVQDHLKPLKPIYNGAGWFIEEKHRSEVEQISRQANMRFVEWPLDGESFDELKRRHKKEFFYEKSIKTRLLIDGLKATLGIYDLDTENLKQAEQRASLEALPNGKKLLDHLDEYDRLQEQLNRIEEEERIANISVKHNVPPITPIVDRIRAHNTTLEKYRGKKHLGLCVKTISEFNDKMLGLRKLILLAAAPNVGKTALTIQLAKEVLLTERDACLVYVSLEMDAEEIFTRMILYLSGLNFDTYVLGSQQSEGTNGYQNFFSEEELRKINHAYEAIEQIGDRLQIIDMMSVASFSAETIIEYINRLKNTTGCNRSIVVIDYLQVWPIPPGMRFSSDSEADKWRIGELKKIREAVNKVNQDPVIVISEARKPSNRDEAWGGDLSDVMGSARGTYTPDAVLLLNQLQLNKLKKLWEDKKMPKITQSVDVGDGEDSEGTSIRDLLARHGIAICSLKMPKGRDGMKKFNILLSFHFRKNKFEPINWLDIRKIAADEIRDYKQDLKEPVSKTEPPAHKNW